MEFNDNVDDYSIDELLEVLHLPDDASVEEVKATIARLINKFRSEGNTKLVNFFIKARQRILEDLERSDLLDDPQDNADSEIGEWWQKQYNSPNDKDVTKDLPDRRNNTVTMSGHHPMKRQQLGVKQYYTVNIAQGENNPNLINITEKIVVVDSKLRPFIFPHDNENPTAQASSTSFDLTLADPIKECLSLQLNSVVLPKTWYNVESGVGNNAFWVNGSKIEIDPGYYDASGLADAMTAAAILPLSSVDYNYKTGKFLFNFINVFPIPLDVSMVFWDRTGEYTTRETYGCNQTVAEPKVDFNLGYMLGFREPGPLSAVSFQIGVSPNNTYQLIPEAVADLEGTKNVYILVEDHNQNRLNNQIVPMAQTETTLSLPPYYSNDISYVCLPGTDRPYYFSVDDQIGLTQAQLYTLNAVFSNQQITRDRVIGPQQANILGVVPVASSNVEWGRNIVAKGHELTANKRVYFGPVSLNKLSVQLIDDLGNVVNLHGRDWSFTMTAEALYQY